MPSGGGKEKWVYTGTHPVTGEKTFRPQTGAEMARDEMLEEIPVGKRPPPNFSDEDLRNTNEHGYVTDDDQVGKSPDD